jgi:hypothetical protein
VDQNSTNDKEDKLKSKHEVVALAGNEVGRLAGLFAVVQDGIVRDLKATELEADLRAAELNASVDGPQ